MNSRSSTGDPKMTQLMEISGLSSMITALSYGFLEVASSRG